MKRMLGISFRIVLIGFLLFSSFAIGSLVSGLTSPNDNDSVYAALSLLGVCIAISLVLSYSILHSSWTGWPLIFTIFWITFAVMTLLTQIETLVFLNYFSDLLPQPLVPKLFLQGFIVSALFSPLAVLVHGKHKKALKGDLQPPNRLPNTAKGWLCRLTVISVLYMIIYASFGSLVFLPLAGQAGQEYYGEMQLPGWVLLFQGLRALIWVTVALPIIKMTNGKSWEVALSVALVYSVLMASLLLIPNDFMPAEIRLAHFVEVFSANFIFGWLVVWILTAAGWWRRDAISRVV